MSPPRRKSATRGVFLSYVSFLWSRTNWRALGNFARNRAFVDFLHAVIARRGPSLSGLIAEAARQGDGWVYLIDQRTRTPDGAVPPEDIIGAFEVRGGQVVTGSYRASPGHRILTRDGFFRLSPDLRAVLLEELASLD